MRAFLDEQNKFHLVMTPKEAANFVSQVANDIGGALNFPNGSSSSFPVTGVRAEDNFEYPSVLSVFVRTAP